MGLMEICDRLERKRSVKEIVDELLSPIQE